MPRFPEGPCACGADAADLGVAASHQIVDIPLETATVTQHDLHEVACRCGRAHRAPAPAGAAVAGTVTYGLALQAWCVYLIAAHAIPVHRCAVEQPLLERVRMVAGQARIRERLGGARGARGRAQTAVSGMT